MSVHCTGIYQDHLQVMKHQYICPFKSTNQQGHLTLLHYAHQIALYHHHPPQFLRLLEVSEVQKLQQSLCIMHDQTVLWRTDFYFDTLNFLPECFLLLLLLRIEKTLPEQMKYKGKIGKWKRTAWEPYFPQVGKSKA